MRGRLLAEGMICSTCGHRGKAVFQSLDTKGPSLEGFLYRGFDPYSGDLYFYCTACGIELEVSPLDFFNGPVVAMCAPKSLDSTRADESKKWLFYAFFIMIGIVFMNLILTALR